MGYYYFYYDSEYKAASTTAAGAADGIVWFTFISSARKKHLQNVR